MIQAVGLAAVLFALLSSVSSCGTRRESLLDDHLNNGQPMAYEVVDALNIPLYEDCLISDDTTCLIINQTVVNDDDLVYGRYIYLYDNRHDLFRLSMFITDSMYISSYDTVIATNRRTPYNWH